jgi:hypothetical protein
MVSQATANLAGAVIFIGKGSSADRFRPSNSFWEGTRTADGKSSNLVAVGLCAISG